MIRDVQTTIDGKVKIPREVEEFIHDSRPLNYWDEKRIDITINRLETIEPEILVEAMKQELNLIKNLQPEIKKRKARELRYQIENFLAITGKAHSNQLENETFATESLEENLFYYDLIELTNGSHIPVTMISKKWRDYFLEKKPIKVRDHDFFYCPNCRNSSFYSFYQGGCRFCGFNKPAYFFFDENERCSPAPKQEKELLNYHKKKQKKKNWWLKSGLWVFHVRAYIKSTLTKNKYPREQVEKYISKNK